MNPSQIAAALMSEYDIHFLIDASGSMGAPHKTGGSQTRWDAAREIVTQFAVEALKIDTDGLNVITFGNKTKTYSVTDIGVIGTIFDAGPNGSTPLHDGLTAAFAVAGSSPKKDVVVVFTDGTPDDPAAARKVIINQVNSQTNDDDCTVLFVQLGNDASATSYLKSLDDDLVKAGAKFDAVDAKTADEVYAASSIAELIQAALND